MSRLARESLLNVVHFALKIAGTSAAFVAIARTLGPEGQGRFGYGLFCATLLGQLALWGLGVAGARFVAEAEGRGDGPASGRAAALVLDFTARGSLIAAGVALLAVGVGGGSDRHLLVTAVLMTPVLASRDALQGVAWGLRDYRTPLVATALGYVALFGTLGPALRSGAPVPAALCALLTSRAVEVLVLRATAGRRLPLRPATPAERRQIMTYALRMAGVIGFGAFIWERSEVLFLRALADWTELGWYTAGFELAGFAARVPPMLSTVLLPMAAQQDGDAGATLRRSQRLLVALLAGPAAVGIGVSTTLAPALYGDAFRPAGPVMSLLFVPLLVAGFGAAGSKVLAGGGGERPLLRLAVAGASFNLVLDIALIPRHGAMGAALACAAAQTTVLLGEGCLARRRFSAPSGDERWWMQAAVAALGGVATASATGAAAATGGEDWFAAACGIAAGTVALAVGIRTLRPLSVSDIAALPGPLPRWLGADRPTDPL